MKLRGLVEMFASKDYDEPDYEGPTDRRGCRIVILATIILWALIFLGVYQCVA
jgi:hypothetical protein